MTYVSIVAIVLVLFVLLPNDRRQVHRGSEAPGLNTRGNDDRAAMTEAPADTKP